MWEDDKKHYNSQPEDVALRETSPAAKSEEKRMFSQARTKRDKNLIWWQDKSQLSYRRIDTQI